MADIYVRSTDGSNADSGATWALAKADLTGAAAIDAAGDFVYLSQSHAESTASALTFTLAGTDASPTRIICGNDADGPPTSVATTATITTTGNSAITFGGANVYVYGVTFNTGSGAVSPSFNCNSTGGSYSVFDNCSIRLVGTSGGNINLSTGGGSTVTFLNTSVRFASTTSRMNIIGATASGQFRWFGGSVLSGGTSPATLFGTNSSGSLTKSTIDGVDLSNLSSTTNIYTASRAHIGVIRNCKLPASWTGSLVTGTLVAHERYEMYNCDSADTNYKLWVQDYFGAIRDETTIIRTGGASDGATGLSWKMTSTANVEYPHMPLYSPEIVRWNDTTGSSVTVTVHVITDNVTLTDGECWLEMQYLGTSGTPLSLFASDAKADVLATAANQTTSSETWTTTGLTTPVKQQLAVTFTPQEKGFITATVKLAKASTTVYVCPKLEVS